MTSMIVSETRFSPLTQIVRRRLLPTPGQVQVRVGDRLQANDIVAQAQVPGRLQVIDLAKQLNRNVQTVKRLVCVNEGDTVPEGEVIASTKGILANIMGAQQVRAPFSGTIQTIEDGYVFLREHSRTMSLSAYMPGQVIEEYPHRGVSLSVNGALVRGVWGSGGEGLGLLATMVGSPSEMLTWERVGLRYRGTIIVGGILQDPRVILRARQFRLAGIIVGSIHARLRSLCEQLPFPVIVTEGVGAIPMARPIFDLLQSYHGHLAVVSGKSNQIEGQSEVIIPLPKQGTLVQNALTVYRPLGIGDNVRLTRPPYMGYVAQVIALPSEPQETAIGAPAAGAQVRLKDGRRVFVPYVNLEPLG